MNRDCNTLVGIKCTDDAIFRALIWELVKANVRRVQRIRGCRVLINNQLTGGKDEIPLGSGGDLRGLRGRKLICAI